MLIEIPLANPVLLARQGKEASSTHAQSQGSPTVSIERCIIEHKRFVFERYSQGKDDILYL